MFDQFFDCLNTRRAGERKEKRKPHLEPYRSVNEVRFAVCTLLGMYILMYVNITDLQWLEKDFLGYLAEWDEMVQLRENSH